MVHRIQRHLGSQHHIIANSNVTAIQENAVIITIEILTHPGITAIIAVERRLNIAIGACFRKKLLYQFLTLVPFGF